MSAPTITEQVGRIPQLPVPELVAEFTRLFGHPPTCKNRIWLWRNVAWKLQELHYGGLSDAARARLEALVSEIVLPTAPPERTKRVPMPSRRNHDALAVGTVLSRHWHDRELRVTVVEAGFECEGRVFRSLSAVARHVTGAHWNGRAFFGLTERAKAS